MILRPTSPGAATKVQDEGVDLPNRQNLNFVGDGATATDDPGNDATKVTIPSASLPSASDVGQILFSVDGSTFEVRLPITTDEGWLVNDEGHLLVVGV